ncbi:hypothetical protein VTK56DRAFT_1117 [Thermocarpiscus australiensis]
MAGRDGKNGYVECLAGSTQPELEVPGFFARARNNFWTLARRNHFEMNKGQKCVKTSRLPPPQEGPGREFREGEVAFGPNANAHDLRANSIYCLRASTSRPRQQQARG